MIIFFILCIAIFANSCSIQNNNDQSRSSYSTESATLAIEIAKDLMNQDQIHLKRWDELFNSKAYKNYLIYSDSISKKKIIRNSMEIVFYPDSSLLLDSLINIDLKMDQNFFKLSMIHNLQKLKDKLSEVEYFIEKLDFDRILSKADSITKTYLPLSIQDSLPKLYDIHLLLSDPDAKVLENSIVLDLYTAYELGEEKLTKLIAHEFHHNYRDLTRKKFKDPLMIQLNKIHQEGLADLIDKNKPPLKELSLYPKSIIDLYNKDFKNTPNNLKRLDSLTNLFINNELDSASYYTSISNFFKFGGHTTGIYMSFLIRDNIGIHALIESYNDPVEFIKIYNEVSKDLPQEHNFSDSFITYIEQL